MAFLEIKNVSIKGLSAWVPKNVVDNSAVYEKKWGGYKSFIDSVGIAKHRNSSADICSSDLCVEAAERLITELGWDKQDIDVLVFVSQTPDYHCVPATSCILQEKMGLSRKCYTLDISLGCSGWVYGLSVISSLMQCGTLRKGILLAGDTPSKFCSSDDKSTYPLFGDAGTATALEFTIETAPMRFSMNTDGKGSDAIMIRDGGYRNPATHESFDKKNCGEGRLRCGVDLEMDGESVFVFGISKVPKSIKDLSDNYQIDLSSIDIFSFHQANLFMNEKIRKKLKIEAEKVPYSLPEYGNTSCASIPLTLVSQCAGKLKEGRVKHVSCGFGVGLSWGSVYFETDCIAVPNLIEL